MNDFIYDEMVDTSILRDANMVINEKEANIDCEEKALGKHFHSKPIHLIFVNETECNISTMNNSHIA